MRDWAPALRAHLASLRLPPDREADIIDELSQHLDERCRDLVAGGLSPDEAERATLAELAGSQFLAPRLAALRHAGWRGGAPPASSHRLFGGLVQDARFAVRLFRRRRGVMSLATFGLAMAIGLSTVVFGAVNALALRPMQVVDPDEVVHVRRAGVGRAAPGWTLTDYQHLRASATLMRAEAWLWRAAPVSADLAAAWHETIPVHLVSETFLETFGARAAQGRLLNAGDYHAGAPIAAVINHSFWTRRFARDPRILGRPVRFGSTPVTIVGVAARQFSGPIAAWDPPAAFWVPLSKGGALYPSRDHRQSPDEETVSIIARLRNADAFDAAQAEASAIATAVSRTADVAVRLRLVNPPLDADDLLTVAMVFGIVGLLLLLACTNVANLLLASATIRQAEVAARLALGASRARIVRQLLTESVLLGLVAGGLGLLLATWAGPALTQLAWIPPTVDLSPDLRVFGFVVLVSIASSMAAGLAPARQAARGDVASALKSGHDSTGTPPRASRLRRGFIGVQAAASIVLLLGASLFGRSLVRTTLGNHGFDPDPLVAVTIFDDDVPARTAVQSVDFASVVLAQVRSLPGVEAAALAVGVPFVGGWESSAIRDAQNTRRIVARQNRTTPEYFSTLGVPVRRGRIFTSAEAAADAPVAVVSAALVRRYWSDEDPIGASLARVHPSLASIAVVGVADDIVTAVRQTGAEPIVFRPMRHTRDARRILIRASDASALLAPLQDALRAIDGRVVLRATRMTDEIERAVGPVRMLAAVSGILGAFALMLAVIGVVGVTAFVVHQRTREIGVRLTLGASKGDIVRLVVGQEMRPVAIGLAVGVLVALLGSGFLRGVLYGIGPRDPIAIGAAVAVLFVSAGIAVLVPATRAARLDPARVLRER